MKIKSILETRRTLSFEFYPPKTEKGIASVFKAIENLKVFRPDFVSVTYGAGGSTQALSEEIALRIQRQNELQVMSHITCVGQTSEEIHAVLVRLEQAGLENVILLRGDPQVGEKSFIQVPGGFAHATDLIRHVKRNFSFGVAAACYPEGHPESPDLSTDLDYIKRKVDEGAEYLITQLFFDNNDFYTLVDRARRAGIEVPIVAGILPILSTTQVRSFTSRCGATIPPALDERLERFVDDPDAARELGIEHATEQVLSLMDCGAQGIHFYSLNRSYSISKILRNLSWAEHEVEEAVADRA